mmetsp:Transcript_21531/g.55045  ORF Transcript_21531/g.55045 Transcript_21531/m.55045 type:complete len:97 (+) Transcript_21531:22-312(+)
MGEEQARLASQLAAEQAHVVELRRRVGETQLRARKLDKRQRILENNISRLYDAAKQRIDERGQALTRARLEAATAPRAAVSVRSAAAAPERGARPD